MPAAVRLLTAAFRRTDDKAAHRAPTSSPAKLPAGAYYKQAKPLAPPKASRVTGSQHRLWIAAATLFGIDVADTLSGAR